MSRHPESIHLLPSEVVDQIAAGEVVDRPAHLVKELVENAIDAGARSIEIEFDQGGRRVRVTDNGAGISPGDLKLALARHATSKISIADDLWHLGTFGFRGEALASIAAVSRMTLQSRPADVDSAHKVVSEFGRLSGPEPTGGNAGTTVLVEELFANVPARLKFLKSETAEVTQIKATLRALALANEDVEFRLRTKGKLESVWSQAPGFLDRAKQVLETSKLYENRFEYNGFQAHVVFASPHDVTGNARSILIFAQKRWVQDRGLQAAVIDAYRGLLMHGEYPIAIVRLQAPSGEVDVNIHPTKSQVKFRDNQAAFRAVNRCLREALERAPWLENDGDADASVSSGSFPRTAPASMADAIAQAASPAPKKLSVADLTRPYEGEIPSTDPASAQGSFEKSPVHSIGRFEAPEFNAIVFKQKQDVVPGTVAGEGAHAEGVERALLANSEQAAREQSSFARRVAGPATGERDASLGPWSRLQVLGQANLTYIVAQDKDRLVLVDQHAAHERVAYERLMRAWTGGQIDVQAMLIPLTVDLEPDSAEALMSIAGDLEKMGVAVDQIGPQSVALRSKPAMISDAAIARSLATLGRELAEKGGSFALEKKISDLCATMACHSVVRAGQALSVDQMKSLLQQMDEFPLSSFCPHGRPVSVDYPFHKLERDFGRIV
jgi:DNA mismatch repair protein MutL